jgi:hypothetical protein
MAWNSSVLPDVSAIYHAANVACMSLSFRVIFLSWLSSVTLTRRGSAYRSLERYPSVYETPSVGLA